MTRVLLTGANGFVGSHIAEALIDAGYQVTCIVRKTSNLKWLAPLPVICEYGDLSDKKFLEICVQNTDMIIHCAGVVRANDKAGYFKNNVENTANLCEAALKSNPGLKKFVFISSQAAMGPAGASGMRRLDEEEKPVSDYGESKLAAEKEVKKLLENKIAYTILRPAAVYGPRDKDIFIFFNLVHKHLRPFTLAQRFLQLVYVKDVAKAAIASFDNPKSDNKTFYLAEETPYSWGEIAKTIAKAMGRTAVPLPLPDFVFKVVGFIAQLISHITGKAAVLNNQKITEMLQTYWAAETAPAKDALGMEFTKLEIASQITYNWYLQNKYF